MRLHLLVHIYLYISLTAVAVKKNLSTPKACMYQTNANPLQTEEKGDFLSIQTRNQELIGILTEAIANGDNTYQSLKNGSSSKL